jgi:hypothetical protein
MGMGFSLPLGRVGAPEAVRIMAKQINATYRPYRPYRPYFAVMCPLFALRWLNL